MIFNPPVANQFLFDAQVINHMGMRLGRQSLINGSALFVRGAAAAYCA
jgi:hypothetical protein